MNSRYYVFFLSFFLCIKFSNWISYILFVILLSNILLLHLLRFFYFFFCYWEESVWWWWWWWCSSSTLFPTNLFIDIGSAMYCKFLSLWLFFNCFKIKKNKIIYQFSLKSSVLLDDYIFFSSKHWLYTVYSIYIVYVL